MMAELDLERRMELFEFMRTHMSLNLVMDSDFEGSNEYASCHVSLMLQNPETGEMEEIASESDSVCISSD